MPSVKLGGGGRIGMLQVSSIKNVFINYYISSSGILGWVRHRFCPQKASSLLDLTKISQGLNTHRFSSRLMTITQLSPPTDIRTLRAGGQVGRCTLVFFLRLCCSVSSHFLWGPLGRVVAFFVLMYDFAFPFTSKLWAGHVRWMSERGPGLSSN